MSKDNQTSPAIQPVSTVTATPATETTPAVAAASSSAAKAETETSPQDTVEISPDAAKDSKATTSGGTAGTSETQDSKTAQDSKKTEEPKETEDPEKKKAQQEEELKAIEKKIEDLKQKVLEDAKKGDTKALEDDLNQLEGLEQERQALINALQPQTSAPQAVPAASSAPAAASSPAASGAPAAMASPISAQPSAPANLSTPAANPSQQISSFGSNPNKAQVGQMLDQAATKYGIPADLLKAVAWQESGWNNSAVGDGGKSHGIMQIYSSAHPDYDVARGQADASYNIDYGAKFLAGLYGRYGDWQTAAMHYNGSGPAAQRYSEKVMALAASKPWEA